MYVVILAGGGGTRLHPLSTPARPKPFLPLLDARSLYLRTIDRVLDGTELGLTPADITVIAARPFGALASAQAPRGVRVIEEPVGRNTAAAVALAAVAIDRPDDEVMIVLPADHSITDEPVFRAVLRAASDGLATGFPGVAEPPLVTLGIQPDHPATGYGYLLPEVRSRRDIGGILASVLEAFVEKPEPARAEALLERPDTAWNAGIFIWRRGSIREAFEAFAPDIAGDVATAWQTGWLEQGYPAVRSASIDRAVMEPAAAAGRVVMAAMDVGWSDLGSWTALLAALGSGATGRVVQPGEAVEVGADDLVIRRRAGRLSIEGGPRAGILDPDGPAALLRGARPDERIVNDLIDRANAPETSS
jgi:mannose-1-phosphate guanylyltransferase